MSRFIQIRWKPFNDLDPHTNGASIRDVIKELRSRITQEDNLDETDEFTLIELDKCLRIAERWQDVKRAKNYKNNGGK